MSCDILKGASGNPNNRVLITLQPGVPAQVVWDFTGCLDGFGKPEPIQAFTIFVTQPRANNGTLRAIKGPLVCGIKISSGVELIDSPSHIFRLGEVTDRIVTLTLALGGTKSLDVEVTTTFLLGA